MAVNSVITQTFYLQMAEAKKLKSGRWRIYREKAIVRDPQTGTIATFSSLTDARRWWTNVNPAEPSLQEAHKCARCGAYFGPSTPWTVHAGRPYHVEHIPC
jgi:hypothetical protein